MSVRGHLEFTNYQVIIIKKSVGLLFFCRCGATMSSPYHSYHKSSMQGVKHLLITKQKRQFMSACVYCHTFAWVYFDVFVT